jgi:hypothetical protein
VLSDTSPFGTPGGHDEPMTPDVTLDLPDDDDGSRSTEVLARALDLAQTIWQSEDKNVEQRPGYDVSVTVRAAVELAGAIQALDTLIRGGYALPGPWRGGRS